MKLLYKIMSIVLITNTVLFAQTKSDTTISIDNKYVESEIISLVNKDGFQLKTASGDFLLNPYLLVLTKGQFEYVDDEGLNLAERDNIVNTGFGIPAALIGFAGKAYKIITFNFALNASASSIGSLLNQAWFDINLEDEFRVRVGKFKTPMHRANLVRIGQNLFPTKPFSLTTRVNIPFDINAVNPTLQTSFDIGFQLHGTLANRFAYQVGIFNGTGIYVNKPTNTLSDDLGIPSLLYSARVAYMPYGIMPLHEGDPGDLNNFKLSFGLSSSFSAEANFESSNDFRTGLEFSMLINRFYLSAEAYTLLMDFVERQKISPNYNFWGSYIQGGYFVSDKIQPVLRLDLMDRNSNEVDGMLYTISTGVNYFIVGQNLKLQCMYQYLGKTGYSSEFEENDDDNGLAEHSVIAQLQFSF